ncbi:hypothetical protein Vadar_007505 [Vaccinium darrowii]|uniref:Uncharacterized protein n=1 Tax=Vaccinium darrowii TaxID=229202 RepID=A0ACB7WYP2_9ERIC|nr:hypothetical protein Vadar_007505 [Vaccinium darrowii]
MTGGKHHHHQQVQQDIKPIDYAKKVKHHKHNEHLAGLGVVAAGTYAKHEKHMIKKDPAHFHKHKIEAKIASAVAVVARWVRVA